MGAEIEVELMWMGDAIIDSSACWNVASSAILVGVFGTEKSRVVSLLHCHEADARLVWWCLVEVWNVIFGEEMEWRLVEECCGVRC